MRYTLRKDKRKRLQFHQAELLSVFSRLNKSDQSLSPMYRFNVANQFAKRPRNQFVGRTKNHCVLTSRSAGVLNFFGLSRIKFRELANASHLAGVKRSSW